MSATMNEYRVTGMTCEHCEMSVREEVEQIDGVDAIEVSAATGLLRVGATGAIQDERVLAAVTEAGYTAVRV